MSGNLQLFLDSFFVHGWFTRMENLGDRADIFENFKFENRRKPDYYPELLIHHCFDFRGKLTAKVFSHK